MKNLLVVLLAFIAFSVSAQKEKDKDQAKAEIFFSRKGSIIEKTNTVIGKLETGSFISLPTPMEVLKIRDLLNNDSIYCVRLTARSGSGTSASSATGYIDADELPNVLNFLKMIDEKYLRSSPPINEVEVQYECLSGFKLGCFNTKNKWQIYLQPKRYESEMIIMDKSAISNVFTVFQNASDFIKNGK